MSQKPSERLGSVLGFNPAKRDPITSSVLSKVLTEVKAEREKEAEQRAAGIVRQALDVAEKMDKARREFSKAEAAFEKQLGQLLGQLGGQPVAEQPAEGESAPSEPPAAQ